MEPIINPWFIYALGAVDELKAVFVVGATLLGISAVVLGVIVGGHKAQGIGFDEKDRDNKKAKALFPFLVRVGSLAAVLALLSCFIPNSKILMGMYAASVATPDNISTVVGAGKSFKDEVKQDIIDLMEHGLDKVEKKDSQK